MSKPLVDPDGLQPWLRASDVEQHATSRFLNSVRPLRDAALADDAARKIYLAVLTRWYGEAPAEGWHFGYNC